MPSRSPTDQPDPLAPFSAPTRSWFGAAFAAPTPAQHGAWEAIRGGGNALVVAPTGSGKTLAAFLWSLDTLARSQPPPEPTRRCRVLYISPLKALGIDVERNLRAPLAGIRGAAQRLGLPQPDITVGVRSGDTPAAQRRGFGTRPPDILITTPESLFLMLTSAAREALRGVGTVIVDEVHAVAGTKRGAHLALSLERLDALLDRPAQRIGLSATVRPVEEVARFLGGAAPVEVVRPPAAKTLEIEVVVPVEDMTRLGEPLVDAPADGSAAAAPPRASIWPAVEERVLDLVLAHSSTIVFANSRRLAERLCARLNELYADRLVEAAAAADGPESSPAAASSDGAGAPPARLAPAAMMGAAGQGGGTAAGWPEVARAHHGSVSREQRLLIEEDLKAGRLPAVVATSSLELGIDMGAVDLVVQIGSPPSVAAGMQRVGRAGHQVDATSLGVVLPQHRGDLLESAVVAERMRAGAIEEVHAPRNPLDVLAQQIVAMTAMDDWSVADLGVLVRRAASFASLPGSVLEAVLDMLAGRYPSDAFAELRPRITWDRATGILHGRPGAQRLAVTSGGTIPDRGMFGVFLIGEKASRVGELDEEMVYESRVGDVVLLGSSSWRIEEITADRVLVTPAPGRPGRLPFWHGDAPGRPAELGRALGAFLREVGRLPAPAAAERMRAAGLDDWAAANLLRYLDEQRAAVGHLGDDRTIVVERFRDEIGDWRLAVHSPFGAPVNAPWALALGARLRERYGTEVQIMHTDDGIVARIPDAAEVPGADLALFEPDEIDAIVRAEIGGSALFASRFRECAGRALLLPRRTPGRRTPLWQQRQRSAQLLTVAATFSDFPIVLETMRECLQDVFDTPALVGLMREVAARSLRVVEVETASPSPFASSLLFGYVAAFLYDGDAPLAERRAQVLSLDSSLLAELLGEADLRELIDPAALAQVTAELTRLAPERRARDAEGVADLLRIVGDLTTAEALARGATPAWLAELEHDRRILRVRIAGEERWVPVEDAGRLRDALGVPLPVGVPEAFTQPVRDPLGDLISRYARTHGPFDAEEPARRLGLGTAVVVGVLETMAAEGRLVRGELHPERTGLQWCDGGVLRALRRRSLAALRREVEAVPTRALGAFLPAWQEVTSGRGRGVDGVLRAVEQLQGALIPASAWEQLVLPARVTDYSPAMLDELCSAGEVHWAGAGGLPGGDGWLTLVTADAAALLLPAADLDAAAGQPHAAILDALADGAALFFRALSDRVGALDDTALTAALWDLVWAGLITNDTLAPLRVALGATGGTAAGAARRRPPRPRQSRYGRPTLPRRTGPPTAAGRWSLLPERDEDPTRRGHALAEALLDRHGIVTRGAVTSERPPGGFAAVYRVLSAFEDAGRARRGYFVESLGAAQFAVPGAVDRLRAIAAAQRDAAQVPSWAPPAIGSAPGTSAENGGLWARADPRRPGSATGRAGGGPAAVVLAATDPANPFGAALPWPERPGPGADTAAGHRPGRKAGALVVLVDGELVLYVERGGRSLLSWTADERLTGTAVEALARAVVDGSLGRLTVEKADGEPIAASGLGAALERAGFHPTPRGLRLRA
ncbi:MULTISPECIES: ATP-dependent helicase [Frankia]|uniref:ATP-dependent helicase, superfamily II with P-loop hydrolase domain and winged helix domain n=1 Tax=Frankia alni (strain DSM 45986 / CECT 9034 / ACN14a) TaxID=326424 RepID=Q0RDW3_FRAAA|nr:MULTISPECIES: ATP-dependent helicase [Frankia]CAJ64353.1 putative ATP-dependent helicase, superfamily II with P-loop hydrolase domain and winged helix domain [Frankia alni ACN14a]